MTDRRTDGNEPGNALLDKNANTTKFMGPILGEKKKRTRKARTDGRKGANGNNDWSKMDSPRSIRIVILPITPIQIM